MQVVHRDGVTLRFSTSAVSFAISKAFLRRRERELIRQKESYNVCRNSICHEFGHIYLEEEWYREAFEQEQIDTQGEAVFDKRIIFHLNWQAEKGGC